MSKRQYRVAVCDTVGLTVENVSLANLLTDISDTSYEWVIAMKEQTDEILDLQPGGSLYFQPNRDDKNSKGIIFRIH